MAHFDETRGAPVERGVHLLAEAGSGKGQMVFRNQLTVEPGRAVAANLPVEVERGQCEFRRKAARYSDLIAATIPG
jgi:hypothetical protein